MTPIKRSILLLLVICCYSKTQAQPPINNLITIKVNQPTATIEPTMWGVFFEDINMGADGGLYAELVKNRSFEFYKPMMGWKILGKPTTEGDFLITNRKLANTANPRYLKVTLHNNTDQSIGLSNEGFRGMGIKKGNYYTFSMLYRQANGSKKLNIALQDSKNIAIGGATITTTPTIGDSWQKASIRFQATATEAKATMNIWFEGDGSIDLDMLSLFPEDTWKNRPGGMRADMVQLLADMKPGFIRFPGGCIVEGYDLTTRYQWKKTIGPIEERQLIVNRWNTEFAHRPTPDYFQTFGLGFFEYFQLAEDIGAAPLPILNCGMACQYNSGELVALDELDPYIQDALDLIEFANGSISTPYGKLRADMGHPAHFNLQFLGIGNENWGPQYIDRLKIFTRAIKEKYPNIKLVNSSGTDPDGARFNYLNKELRAMNADIIDEHYYRKPDWFLQNVTRYDNYPRNSSKIFAGEYAAQSDKTVSVDNKNNWQTAMAEAAFLTGLERNADVVHMASYAPLFAHIDAWQWAPDMIWVDNLRSFGTPNYYVQKLFSLNKGTQVVPAHINNTAITGQNGLYASAAISQPTNEVIIKLVNTTEKEQTYEAVIAGLKKLPKTASITLLKGAGLTEVNSLEHPFTVAPQESVLKIVGKKIPLILAPYSFTIVKVHL